MSRMNAGIVLAGQQPDFLGTIHRANQAAAAQNDIQRQNALADFYQSNGAAVAQGDQQALNALAGFDPMAAMDVQKQRLGMDATRQNMRINEQELQMRKEHNARAAQKWAMTQDAATVQAEAAKMRRGLMMAGQAYQAGDEQAFRRILQENGVQPFPMAEFPYRAAEYEGMLEGLEAAGSFGKPEQPEYGVIGNQFYDKNNPGAGAQPIPNLEADPADEYGRYVQEQRALGQEPLSRIDYAQAKRGDATVVYDPQTGRPLVSIGGGTGTGEMTVGEAYNPGEINGTLALIDEIASSSSLSKVVGPLEGGGGNDVDEFNAVQRAYYGGDGLATIQKINQLQSRSWLAARAMLKGGGPITDYESRKAEAAVARLSRAQDEKEFLSALNDLKSAITEGRAKLEAAQNGGADARAGLGGAEPETPVVPQFDPQTPDFSQMSDEELQQYIERGGQ